MRPPSLFRPPLHAAACAATWAVVLGMALLALPACDGHAPILPPPPDPDDEVVAGVNLTRLFEDSEPVEIGPVVAAWAARDATRGARYRTALVGEHPAADGATLAVWAAVDAGTGDTLAHAAVRRPRPRFPGDVGRRPLVLWLPEDRPAYDAAAGLAALPVFPTEADDYVFATFAYRGRPLDVGGRRYASTPDPAAAYDLDVDDALALFDAVRAGEPLVAAGPGAAMGHGRGGTAAFLATRRAGTAGRLALAVSLGGPTDFLLPTLRDQARAYLTGTGSTPLPAFADVAATILAPLRDGTITLEEARHLFLLRSPGQFVEPPPDLVAIYALIDPIVPVAHGRALRLALGTEGTFYYELEEPRHDELPTFLAVRSTVTARLLAAVPSDG